MPATKLLGESPEAFGDVMVALSNEAEPDGCFFGVRVLPLLQQYAALYTAEQRLQIEGAGFPLAAPRTKKGGEGDNNNNNNGGGDDAGGGGGGGDDDDDDDDDDDANALRFWGVHGKRRLLNRLSALGGPGREFVLRKELGHALSTRRKTALTAIFGCTACGIRHACRLNELARPELTSASFRCLCSPAFTHRDLLNRRGDVAWRNMRTFVQAKLNDTELLTPRETFLGNRSSVVLKCTRCAAETRLQPREIFGKQARCACCHAPPAAAVPLMPVFGFSISD